MTTKEIIDSALAAASAKASTASALSAAQSVDAEAGSALAAANQTAHDDLVASGQALYISADTPPVYSVASAVEPDTFVLAPIRVA